ncbi:MAG: Hvo_1808 family surface protein, partial [Halorhabdus sp.]
MTARTRSLVVVLAVALALQPALVATTLATPTATVESPIADRHPPDPETDVLGWEDGYWYNETVSVTPDDGLNDSELNAVVARGMARVEEIRRLEFEQTPPVEVIGREEYRERVANRTSNVTTAQRLHQNVKYEALLMVNESADAIAVQQRNRAGGVGGFYDPSTGEIKIVSENTSAPKMDEITLAQELFHALQDQQFNISSFNQTTRELHNAKDGIIEGDGNYVDHLYQERCENEWKGTCITPQGSAGAPANFDPHIGLYQIMLQPYSDGPAFVRDIQQSKGWDAVNAIYENPPASTEQTIHPEKYGEDEPTPVPIADTSNDRWRPLDINASVDFASFGEAGLFVTLWYPGYESQLATQIIPYQSHLNLVGGSVAEFDPYNYNHTYTNGWDGDKLVPYVTDESAETNETGYVYKTIWDSPADAKEFQKGYTQLLAFHGAKAVDGHEHVYRIPEGTEFNDVFYLNRTGETFTIVNAPSVAALSAVHGAAPEFDASTGTTTPEDGGTDTTDGGTGSGDETTTGTDD